MVEQPQQPFSMPKKQQPFSLLSLSPFMTGIEVEQYCQKANENIHHINKELCRLTDLEKLKIKQACEFWLKINQERCKNFLEFLIKKLQRNEREDPTNPRDKQGERPKMPSPPGFEAELIGVCSLEEQNQGQRKQQHLGQRKDVGADNKDESFKTDLAQFVTNTAFPAYSVQKFFEGQLVVGEAYSALFIFIVIIVWIWRCCTKKTKEVGRASTSSIGVGTT